jgi:hypothetical protein
MTTVKMHWDADGLTSGLFTTYHLEDSIPEIGDCEKGFGNTSGLTKDDWMVDMKPADPNWTGTCIDHHLPHPEERKYTLFSDDVPASLIAYNKFKDDIPKSERWKLAIGLVGDVSAEHIPVEVFKETPSLLMRVKTSAYNKYGRWSINYFPLYKLLSSGINSLLKKGELESAWNLIKFADKPLTLYNSQDANLAKNDIRNEVKTAITDSDQQEFNNLVVVGYYSKYRLSGHIASVIHSSLNDTKTVLAINKRNGALSMRGELSHYYKDILSTFDYIEIDGHRVAMGGKLRKNYVEFMEDLHNLLTL